MTKQTFTTTLFRDDTMIGAKTTSATRATRATRKKPPTKTRTKAKK